MLSLPGFALVTGSGNGIGRVIARSFAKAGAAGVHIADINKEAAREASEDISSVATNPNFKALTSDVVDVSQEEDVKKMLDLTKSKFGRLDYAVNNAGIVEPARLTADVPIEGYDKIIAINQRGVHLCMQAQLRLMRSQNAVRQGDRPPAQGAIVNMSSIAGIMGLEEAILPSYAASKHAVVGMTRIAVHRDTIALALDLSLSFYSLSSKCVRSNDTTNLAAAYAQHNIRVNAVCPGCTNTTMMAHEGLGETSFMISRVPQRRLIRPEEVADVVLFLASESASAVTGVAWAVDGGRSAV